DLAKRAEKLEKLVDVDRFLTLAALEVMTCHWDGYAMHANNYRVYHDPDSGKITIFPHGMDQMFGNTGGSIDPPAGRPNARADVPDAGISGPLLRSADRDAADGVRAGPTRRARGRADRAAQAGAGGGRREPCEERRGRRQTSQRANAPSRGVDRQATRGAGEA